MWCQNKIKKSNDKATELKTSPNHIGKHDGYECILV